MYTNSGKKKKSPAADRTELETEHGRKRKYFIGKKRNMNIKFTKHRHNKSYLMYILNNGALINTGRSTLLNLPQVRDNIFNGRHL